VISAQFDFLQKQQLQAGGLRRVWWCGLGGHSPAMLFWQLLASSLR